MSEAGSYLKIYRPSDSPELMNINRREIRRYAGMNAAAFRAADMDASGYGALAETDPVMEECIDEILPKLTYRVSYRYDNIPTPDSSDKIKLPFNFYESKNVTENLLGCTGIIMFAATIGIEIDRMIEKYGRISPVKALFLQAIGAERIEALCDTFCSSIPKDPEILSAVNASFAPGVSLKTRPRFSPGYGDLPLEAQKEFFTLLDCQRRLGLTLNESLLMSPGKSVTAFVGLEPADPECTGSRDPEYTGSRDSGCGQERLSGCGLCGKTDCQFRDIQ